MDPVNWIDPTGLCEWCELKAVRTAVGTFTVFVYKFIETATNRFYFGITNDPLRRLTEHGTRVVEGTFEVIEGFTAESSVAAREAARAIEQGLILNARQAGQDIANIANSMSMENFAYYMDFANELIH